MDNSTFSNTRRQIIKASAASVLLPTTAIAKGEARQQHRYGLHDIVMGHETGKGNPHDRPTTMVNYRTGGTPWGIMIDPNGNVIFNDFSINADAAIDYLKKEIARLS